MTMIQSEKSWNISCTICCSRPLAGPTPSGRNFGRASPHGVATVSNLDIANDRGIWWKLLAISKSINILKFAAFMSSYCGLGIGLGGIMMYLLTQR